MTEITSEETDIHLIKSPPPPPVFPGGAVLKKRDKLRKRLCLCGGERDLDGAVGPRFFGRRGAYTSDRKVATKKENVLAGMKSQSAAILSKRPKLPPHL